MSTTGFIKDDFSFNQNFPSSVSTPSGWYPYSTRSLDATAASGIPFNHTSGGVWAIGVTSGSIGDSASLQYDFVDRTNLSTLTNIQLTGVSSSANVSWHLTLFDGTPPPHTIVGSVSGTTVTWNLSSWVGFTNLQIIQNMKFDAIFTAAGSISITVADMTSNLPLGVVTDTFSTTQGSPSTIAPPTTIDWDPPGSRQMLIGAHSGTAVNNIGISNVAHWTVQLTGADVSDLPVSMTITYAYSPAMDFTMMANISLRRVTRLVPASNISYSLRLISGVNSATAPGAVTPEGGDPTLDRYVWPLNNTVFPLIDFTAISNMRLIAIVNNINISPAQAQELSALIVCMARDSMILMADGSEKPIQDIRRGDLIAGHDGSVHEVARNMHSRLNKQYSIDLVKVDKDALGENLPNKDLLISGWHPILWEGARRPARCFEKFPGVQWWYHSIQVEDILPADNENATTKTYSFYNLQFDHDGIFIANGIPVQAISPYSRISPLKKELFFNLDNYKEKLVNESYITDTPWDGTVLEAPIKSIKSDEHKSEESDESDKSDEHKSEESDESDESDESN